MMEKKHLKMEASLTSDRTFFMLQDENYLHFIVSSLGSMPTLEAACPITVQVTPAYTVTGLCLA